ncbi:hypothetical protein J6590_004326 [Homalodisca vitripennis]|nr:hypothetical protein J6590_004326 [Homalodisca vitripennis]
MSFGPFYQELSNRQADIYTEDRGLISADLKIKRSQSKSHNRRRHTIIHATLEECWMFQPPPPF